jgi:hypothetical protein
MAEKKPAARSPFVVWRPGSRPEEFYTFLRTEVKDDFELTYGVSRSKGWPKKAFAVAKRTSSRIKLTDSPGMTGCLLASPRLREFLEADKGLHATEFLPVELRKPDGEVLAKGYSIVHPLDVCDCIDPKKSGAKLHAIDKKRYGDLRRLVLRLEKIPAKYVLFRPKFMLGIAIIRRELADAMTEAGFTGLNFYEPENYNILH